MAKPAARIVFLEVVLTLAGAAVVARSFWLQVIHHRVWVEKSTNNRERDVDVSARRGRIYDRNGQPLAVSRTEYVVSVSLNQVPDTAALAARLVSRLSLSRAKVADQFRGRFPYFQGPFRAEEVDSLRGARGVYLFPVFTREYPMDSLAPRILGRLNQAGDSGIEGMEKALDTLLQGQAGQMHVLIDARGKEIPVPGPPLVDAVAGHDVELTLDANLQGIAEGALLRGIAAHKALGGDVVIIDIHTGELLAVASRRTDTITHQLVATSSAIVEPNEPGSTSKLFSVAAILRSGVDTTPVFGENGVWMQPIAGTKPRHIADVDAIHGMETLGEVVKYSSNIGITKFSAKLAPDQQYTAIRDFGFGTSPGLGFPGETPGRLPRPARWINRTLTMGSLAMGYEWEASAVQLASGYAAIANDGVLMAPTLVRAVRDENGAIVWQHRPDTIRRVVPDSIAQHLNEYLTMTEGDGGTGVHAQLDRFKVPGKSGTAQVKVGRDIVGYRSSFVGIFPEAHPQVVVYVMIDRPHSGDFYGGSVAAPIVRQVLQEAIDAPASPLDRRDVIERVPPPAAAPAAVVALASVRRVGLPAPGRAATSQLTLVPAVAGQSARDAIVAMERAGFQVRLVGHAHVRTTAPAAGDSLPRGSVVTITADSLP